ncbi:MAG TPA: nodulation protein NfeD [Geobacteraceae bacterium]
MVRALTIIMLLMSFSSVGMAASPAVRVLTVDGPINPVTADYLRNNLHAAALNRESLVLIEMDTPGGLDAAMRDIVKEELASPVPVAVFVTPSGARAASAGAVIGLAADVLAMSPGTNIGAAHPVSIGETPDKVMQEKLENDAEAYLEGIARKRGRNSELARSMVRQSISLSAEKALDARIIDLLAADRSELLHKLDGRIIQRDGGQIALRLGGAEVKTVGMSGRQRILNTISNPNVAYVLMMLGFLGLFFELSNPGVILPGVVGGISLLLSFYAFQTLPVNYAGVLLIVFALILFIAEIKIVSHGMLAVGGIISMVLGSLLLFESTEPYLRLSWEVIITTVLATSLFFLVAVTKAVQVHRRKPVTGAEGLVGESGRAETDLAPEGKVFVRGEYWDAVSDERVAAGEKVMVVAVEGMRVRVRKASPG